MCNNKSIEYNIRQSQSSVKSNFIINTINNENIADDKYKYFKKYLSEIIRNLPLNSKNGFLNE